MTKPNSTRAQDWSRFLNALSSYDVLDILHTGKNILVEEARRWGSEIRPSKW